VASDGVSESAGAEEVVAEVVVAAAADDDVQAAARAAASLEESLVPECDEEMSIPATTPRTATSIPAIAPRRARGRSSNTR
jgi:hypothetical protein